MALENVTLPLLLLQQKLLLGRVNIALSSRVVLVTLAIDVIGHTMRRLNRRRPEQRLFAPVFELVATISPMPRLRFRRANT